MKAPGVFVTFQQVIPWELATGSKISSKTLTTVGSCENGRNSKSTISKKI